jgi:hypothetical protein
MTAGAPLGSFAAGRLFRSGATPTAILHVAAVLLGLSAILYTWINAREERRTPVPLLSAEGGFGLVLNSAYLRLVALLVVLLNVVNTTGEYLVARLLSAHVAELAALNAAFDKQAYIGAFSADYQFWVNVSALVLQTFVTARLVKYRGLAGVLLALPLIALGGYAIVAGGVGFSVFRWIKTAENATDYSIMNTARQLLWLPTSREDKYKAKQAIDTFFVRGGDVLSAVVVYVGAALLRLNVQQFAAVNIVLALAWMAVAVRIIQPRRVFGRLAIRQIAAAALGLAVITTASPASAQETREEQLAARQAQKAASLTPYESTRLEQRLERVERMNGAIFGTSGPAYTFIGTTFDGGGLAAGPGYRARFGDTGTFDTHAAWSVKNYKAVDAVLRLPTFGAGRVQMDLRANWLDAPDVAFYKGGNDSREADRTGFFYRTTTVGTTMRVQASRGLAVGAGLDSMRFETGPATAGAALATATPSYLRSSMFAEVDRRASPGYTTSGGLYRVDWSRYQQTNEGAYDFTRIDAEAQQFIPVLRNNWVIALRALASTTETSSGQEVPYFLLPDLGGSHTLRGYSAWRFRDRNRMLMTAEYRWTAGSFVDMALFLDAGKVAPRARDLDMSRLTKTYGIGMSLHTPLATVTRIELARTTEGSSLVFSFSPSF